MINADDDFRHGDPILPQSEPIEREDETLAAPAEFIDRIHIAILTMLCLPGDGPRGFFTTWPAYRHTWWDEGNELSQRADRERALRFTSVPRFKPTPRQIDDCLPTLALLDGEDRTTRMIVMLRARMEWYGPEAYPGGWRGIAIDVGLTHHTQAKRRYDAAMQRALSRLTAEPLRANG